MSQSYFDAGPEPKNGRKIFLATPSYDNPDSSYTFSIARTREAMHLAGIPSSYMLLVGNAHVDDSRNDIVRDFIMSDCSELLFIDADVSWKPQDVIDLCGYDEQLVGGVYPYRRVSGNHKMPVRNLSGKWEPDERGLLEVAGLPTGFMKIHRSVIEKLTESCEHYTTSEGMSPLLFERWADDLDRWGGDINFCRKWREAGGRLYAAANLTLGHCGKVIVRGSLAASLRHQAGATVPYVVQRIKSGTYTIDDITEAKEATDNKFGAQEDCLCMAVGLARQAKGPILEAGSGLSTVLIAAATEQNVICLEHEEYFARQTEGLARSAGVLNIGICHAPLKDRWYDQDQFDGMPERFSFAFVDGPPRKISDRMRFFEVFGNKCDMILCDDADDDEFAQKVKAWATAFGWTVKHHQDRAILLEKDSGSSDS